jgi:hypothetical protein
MYKLFKLKVGLNYLLPPALPVAKTVFLMTQQRQWQYAKISNGVLRIVDLEIVEFLATDPEARVRFPALPEKK